MLQYIYLQYYQLAQQLDRMRARVKRYFQKKCNFCFQWAQQSTEVNSDMFCCNKCYEKITMDNFTVSTQNSDVFKLSLEKESSRFKSQNLLNPNTEELKNAFLNWSNIKSFIEDNEISQDQIEQIYINDLQEKDNPSNRSNGDEEYFNYNGDVKSFNDELELGKQNFVYQSYILNSIDCNKSLINVRSATNLGMLSQICSNNQKSRFVKKYNYHYNKEEIQRYKNSFEDQNKDQIAERQFGTQLKPLQLSNINAKTHNLNLKNSNFRKIKFQRLHLSKSTVTQNERLTDQELKNKIFPYLQQKTQSKTLNRLMATYVKEAYCRSNIHNTMLELISFKMTSIDLQCFLNLFDFNHINVIKLVKVGLTDEQLHILVEHIQHYKVEILVLTGNNLSQNVLSYLNNKSSQFLREIYLGKNRISKFKCKQNIAQLRNRYTIHI